MNASSYARICPPTRNPILPLCNARRTRTCNHPRRQVRLQFSHLHFCSHYCNSSISSVGLKREINVAEGGSDGNSEDVRTIKRVRLTSLHMTDDRSHSRLMRYVLSLIAIYRRVYQYVVA